MGLFQHSYKFASTVSVSWVGNEWLGLKRTKVYMADSPDGYTTWGLMLFKCEIAFHPPAVLTRLLGKVRGG